MTLNDILKQQNLTDAQIEAILKAMKDNKVYTAGAENLDIRYGKLRQDFDALTAQHGESVKLIEQLRRDSKGSETLQKSVADYQAQIAAMQAQRDQDRLSYALRLALMGGKALDVDYLTYKVLEKHPEWKEHPENALDESGRIKGADDLMAGLKTQFPQQFEGAASSARTVEAQRLPDQQDNRGGVTRSDVLKKPYAERARLFEENPDAYRAAMHSEQ